MNAPDQLPDAVLLPAGRMPVYALLDNVRSVWNVGSMFRTADAAGLAGMYLTGMTATPPRPDMEKTALGATRSVPWDYWRDPREACRSLRARGVRLVALEQAAGAADWETTDWRFPVCFVVGHEVEGVADDVLSLVDEVVEIPMAGVKKSLNVAVSFGILAYGIRRCWLDREGR
jgi:tRNA G18 (ribose-2'-O)-methylase SpoU